MLQLFSVRELLVFPSGENATDVLINGIHFNRTALDFFNYTLYSNGTLSNSSNCYLTFDVYQPSMTTNGTFINGTSCYDPYYGISQRGSTGIGFACLFTATIMFTLINLRKHGRLFLPSEKRFRAIGRRWQWYWMLFVAACGMISDITGIDVDRDYLQSTAIVLQSFFYYLMIPGILATVWEAVRHWGSWQERQIYDLDPFSLPQNDRRGKKQLYLPLVFYLFAWLYFFMTIPRTWTDIEYQRSLQQQNRLAKPAATDNRFKAAGIFAFLAWCTICYSLQQSIHHYKPKNRGAFNSTIGLLRHTPTKFIIAIPLLLISVGYAIASSFVWDISPLKYNVMVGWMYGLGQGPIFLILLVFEVWGYIDQNEDRVLLEQRAERGRSIDTELGLAKKPGWWSKLSGGHHLTMEQRLASMTGEIGGGRATGKNLERTIELGNMPAARPLSAEDNPFGDDASSAESDRRLVLSMTDSDEQSGRAMSERTMSTVASRPQEIRSMLDI